MRLGTADVLVRAKTDQYNKDLKKTEENTRDFGKNAAAGARLAATGFVAVTASIVGVGGALSLLIQSSAREAKELQNLSRLAKMSVADFTAIAFATEKVGVNAEKLGDITKDVQDKLGDFIATGGGEFKDFMENVAVKVGLTAEALQKLSGPDALIAIKKAMDDANVSAEEQVFYMESIANDATLLLPLLRDNGKALKEEAERAKQFGIALSEIEVQKLLDAGSATTDMSASFKGLTTRVAVEFAPVYADVMRQSVSLTASLKDEVVILARETASFMKNLFGSKTEIEKQLDDYQTKIGVLLEKRGRLGGHLTETEEKTLAVYRAQIVQLQSLERIRAKATENTVNANGAPVVTPSAIPPPQNTTSILDQYTKLDSAIDKYFGSLDTLTAKEAKRTLDIKASTLATEQHILALNGIQNATTATMDPWQKKYELRVKYQADALKEISGKEKTFAEEAQNAVTGWASGFSASLTDMLFDADATFSDILTSFAKMTAQMIIQQGVTKAVEWGFSSITASAQGNVYSGAGISAYNNQIVSQPTVFPFAKGAGLMGEAGSEAIMPLTRMPGGDLGVKSSGGGAVFNQTVQITVQGNNSGNKADQEQLQDRLLTSLRQQTIELLAEEKNRFGGVLFRG